MWLRVVTPGGCILSPLCIPIPPPGQVLVYSNVNLPSLTPFSPTVTTNCHKLCHNKVPSQLPGIRPPKNGRECSADGRMSVRLSSCLSARAHTPLATHYYNWLAVVGRLQPHRRVRVSKRLGCDALIDLRLIHCCFKSIPKVAGHLAVPRRKQQPSPSVSDIHSQRVVQVLPQRHAAF